MKTAKSLLSHHLLCLKSCLAALRRHYWTWYDWVSSIHIFSFYQFSSQHSFLTTEVTQATQVNSLTLHSLKNRSTYFRFVCWLWSPKETLTLVPVAYTSRILYRVPGHLRQSKEKFTEVANCQCTHSMYMAENKSMVRNWVYIEQAM